MKNKTDFFIGLTLLVFSCVMGHQILLLPESATIDFFTAGSFPTGITILLALLSLVLMVKAVLNPPEAGMSYWPEKIILVRVTLIGIWILCYVTGFILIGEYAYNAQWPDGSGFVLSTFLFLTGAEFLAGYRSLMKILLIATGISIFLYVVFAVFFKVPLP